MMTSLFSFKRLAKIETLLFFLSSIAVYAGELVVMVPVDRSPGGGGMYLTTVGPYEGETLGVTPEIDLVQEGQIERSRYRGVNPGRYRVALTDLGYGMGFGVDLMETHVTVSEDSPVTVYLFEPTRKKVQLPEELETAVAKYTKKDYEFFDLSASFKGSKKKFYQIRLPSNIKGGFLDAIYYLRSDCEYTLELLSESDPDEEGYELKVVFSTTFKIESPNEEAE